MRSYKIDIDIVICFQFPLLKGFIYGEEENVFTNALGERIVLVLNDDESNTMGLLTKILNGDAEAARSLSHSVHQDIPIEKVPVISLPNEIPSLNIDDLALWIDPIGNVSRNNLFAIYLFINYDSDEGLAPLSHTLGPEGFTMLQLQNITLKSIIFILKLNGAQYTNILDVIEDGEGRSIKNYENGLQNGVIRGTGKMIWNFGIFRGYN